MTRTENLLTFTLTICLFVALAMTATRPAAATPYDCQPDCAVWVHTARWGYVPVQLEYLPLIYRTDCVYFEDASIGCPD